MNPCLTNGADPMPLGHLHKSTYPPGVGATCIDSINVTVNYGLIPPDNLYLCTSDQPPEYGSDNDSLINIEWPITGPTALQPSREQVFVGGTAETPDGVTLPETLIIGIDLDAEIRYQFQATVADRTATQLNLTVTIDNDGSVRIDDRAFRSIRAI